MKILFLQITCQFISVMKILTSLEGRQFTSHASPRCFLLYLALNLLTRCCLGPGMQQGLDCQLLDHEVPAGARGRGVDVES